MVWSHFLREAKGHTTVTFDFTIGGETITLEAAADPMSRGPEWMAGFLDDLSRFRKLLTPDSGFALFALFPRQSDIKRLYVAWLDAAGLDDRKMAMLQFALRYLEDLEADLLRVYPGVDIREWFTGGMSSRRVAVLVGDLIKRPETLLGAQFKGIVNPLSQGELMLAVSVAAGDGKPHPAVVTHEQQEAARLERESIARMQARGLSA